MQLVRTDIPAEIATVEQLVFWGIASLKAANPELAVIEGAESVPYALTIGTYVIPANPSTPHRVIGRYSFEILPDHGSRALWRSVQPLSGIGMLDQFKAANV